MKKNIRAAIYTRKSCEDKEDKCMTSCEAQRGICEKFAMDSGFEILETEYSDYGFTGGNTDRPALKRLLIDIEEGKIDVVVAYKLDRISRSVRDFANLVDHFERHNVKFLTTNGDFSMDNTNAKFTTTMFMAIAELERGMISDRIRDKKKATFQAGYWNGGVPPLGYINKDKKLVPDPERAHKIAEIFDKYANGTSLLTLAKDERYQGLKEGRKRKVLANGERSQQPLSYADLRNIIKNSLYKGYITCKNDEGKRELFKAQHQPLVSEELWQKANDRFKEKNTYKGGGIAEYKSLLSGLLRCEECQACMYAKRRQHSYVCSHKHGIETCKGLNAHVPAFVLETLVLNECQAALDMSKPLQGKKIQECLMTIREDLVVSSVCRKECLAFLTGHNLINEEQKEHFEKWGTIPKSYLETLLKQKSLSKTTREELQNREFSDRLPSLCEKILSGLGLTPALFKYCMTYAEFPTQFKMAITQIGKDLASCNMTFDQQYDILHALIKRIDVAKDHVRIVFTTKEIGNILGEWTRFKGAPKTETTFERIIPGAISQPRRILKQGKKRIPLKRQAHKSLKSAFEQYLMWEKEIDQTGCSIRDLWRKYACSYTTIKSYFKFGALLSEVRKAISEGKLDNKFRISDITEGKFPFSPNKQLKFFGLI